MDGRESQHQALPRLFAEILQARQVLRHERRRGQTRAVAREKERQLHKALKDYALALAELKLPVPCVIRDELRIYGDLLAAYGDSRPGR